MHEKVGLPESLPFFRGSEIPRNELEKVVIEGNTSPSVEGGRVGAT